jgi:uncharacterized RDD family membrane protein YckC
MSDKESEDWDFKVDDSSLEKEKDAQKKEIKEKSSTLKKARKNSKKKLKLEEGSKTQFRSGRQASYKEEKNKNKVKVTPGKPGKRLIAYLIDNALIAIIAGFIPKFFPDLVLQINAIYPIDSVDNAFVLSELTKVATGALGIIGFLVLIVFPMGAFGQTLGLKILKIRIEHIDGGTIGVLRSLLRNSIGLTLNTIFVFGLVMPFFQKQKRTFHDLLFSSICIEDDY